MEITQRKRKPSNVGWMHHKLTLLLTLRHKAQSFLAHAVQSELNSLTQTVNKHYNCHFLNRYYEHSVFYFPDLKIYCIGYRKSIKYIADI